MSTYPRYLLENKQLSVALELKSFTESGRFAGYASVFNVIDNQRDIMMPGAFKATLYNRKNQVKLLWQHQFEEPIGTVETLFEDARGLYIEGQLLLDITRGREVYTLLKAGAVSGLSIGYSPIRYVIDPDSGVRKLQEVELWEVSLVTFPANEDAQVTVVKSQAPYANVTMNAPDDFIVLPQTDRAIFNKDWHVAQKTGALLSLMDALDHATSRLRQ